MAIGYGVDGQQDKFLIVKNSWGEWWGEKGFVKISMSKKESRKGVLEIYNDDMIIPIVDGQETLDPDNYK